MLKPKELDLSCHESWEDVNEALQVPVAKTQEELMKDALVNTPANMQQVVNMLNDKNVNALISASFKPNFAVLCGQKLSKNEQDTLQRFSTGFMEVINEAEDPRQLLGGTEFQRYPYVCFMDAIVGLKGDERCSEHLPFTEEHNRNEYDELLIMFLAINEKISKFLFTNLSSLVNIADTWAAANGKKMPVRNDAFNSMQSLQGECRAQQRREHYLLATHLGGSFEHEVVGDNYLTDYGPKGIKRNPQEFFKEAGEANGGRDALKKGRGIEDVVAVIS